MPHYYNNTSNKSITRTMMTSSSSPAAAGCASVLWSSSSGFPISNSSRAVWDTGMTLQLRDGKCVDLGVHSNVSDPKYCACVGDGDLWKKGAGGRQSTEATRTVAHVMRVRFHRIHSSGSREECSQFLIPSDHTTSNFFEQMRRVT
jgi:hypothetical protein